MLQTAIFQPPTIIAIAGGSCSGKTTLAQHLAKTLGDAQCLLIRQDDYYIDIRVRETLCTQLPNFDVPEAIDFKQLRDDLEALRRGEDVFLPNYDFTTHQRQHRVTPASHRPFIIVEGILILADDNLRGAFDHSCFMLCEEDVRYGRRLSRDITERGRTPESVEAQFYGEVAPAHNKYVAPSAAHASEVITQSEYCDNLQGLGDRLIALWTQGVVSPTAISQ